MEDNGSLLDSSVVEHTLDCPIILIIILSSDSCLFFDGLYYSFSLFVFLSVYVILKQVFWNLLTLYFPFMNKWRFQLPAFSSKFLIKCPYPLFFPIEIIIRIKINIIPRD